LSTLTPERQTAAETNQLLSMMGVTRDDLRRMRKLTATGTRLRDCASLGAIIARSAAV